MSQEESPDDTSVGSELENEVTQDSSTTPDDDPEPSTETAGSPTGPESDFVDQEESTGNQTTTDESSLRRFLRRQFALQMENVIPEDIQRILDRIEERLEDLQESEEVNFADKLYGRIRLSARMFKAWAEGSFQLPWKSVVSIAAGLTYLLNPLDFLPDIFKGDEAVLDDALVIYLCYTVVEQDLARFLREHNLDPEEFGMDSVPSGY